MRGVVTRLTVGVVAAALVFAGCGGGGGTARLSKTAFIARGEQLCKELKADLDPLFDDFVATLPKKAAAYRKAVPLGRSFSRRFAALRPPKSDEATINASIKDYDAGVDRLEAGVRAAEAGDVAKTNAEFAEGFKALGRSDAALKAYGFTVCAEPKTERSPFPVPDSERVSFSAEKNAYIQQADRLCAAANARLRPLETPTFSVGVPDLAAWGRFLTSALPVFQQELDQVRALKPPAADAATIAGMLGNWDRGLASAKAANDAAGAGDQARFNAAMNDVARFALEGDRIARTYGFRDCKER
jgi:hypothetical protein